MVLIRNNTNLKPWRQRNCHYYPYYKTK